MEDERKEVKGFVTQFVELIHDMLWQHDRYITATDVLVEYYRRNQAYLRPIDVSEKQVRLQGSEERVIAQGVRDQTGSKTVEKAKNELGKCLKLCGRAFDEQKQGNTRRFRYPQGLAQNPLEKYWQGRESRIERLGRLLRSAADLFPASWVSRMDLQLYQQKDAPLGRTILQFAPTHLAGIELVPQLYDHCVARQVVSFSYRPFGKAPCTAVVAPYRLREYNQRWFLLCMNRNRQGQWHYSVYAVDRIVSAIALESAFDYVEPPFDVDAYYADVVGLTRHDTDEPQHIVLTVTDERALGYIASKPLHPSQQVCGQTVRLRAVLNYELETRIWEFADRLHVEAPEALRQSMEERARKVLAGGL